MSERPRSENRLYEFLQGYVGARPNSEVNTHLEQYVKGLVESKKFSKVLIYQTSNSGKDVLSINLVSSSKITDPESRNTMLSIQSEAMNRWVQPVASLFSVETNYFDVDMPEDEAKSAIENIFRQRQEIKEYRLLWEGMLN